MVYRKMPNAGGADRRYGHEQLVERVDAQQMLLGHEQRHGGHHGGAVEGLSDAAHDDEDHEQRKRYLPEQDDDAQPQRHDSHGQVGHDHDRLAVVLVGDDAAEGRQQSLRRYAQMAAAASMMALPRGLGGVPHHGVSRGVAGDHGSGLSAPDGGDDRKPALRQLATGCAQGRGRCSHG